jgi:hypothetical protein
MKRACSDCELWRKRYEALRGQVDGSGVDVLADPPLGMYLIRYYGVAEWMRRWIAGGEDYDARSTPVHSPALRPVEFPPASLWREQLTVLLAQMTFQHLRTA